MADIRIKDLAVTAGSSASDDYLAVDGSTNGTRKLSAYSPTFGGNLTVSGTATANGGIVSAGSPTGYSGGEFKSSVTTAGAQTGISTFATGGAEMLFDHRGTGNTGAWSWRNGTGAATTRMSLSSDGNLTVSGSSIGVGGAIGSYLDILQGGNDAYFYNRRAGQLTLGTNNSDVMQFKSNGNCLIGESTDYGYKLYVNGSSYSYTSIRAKQNVDISNGNLNTIVIVGDYIGYNLTNSPAGTAWLVCEVFTNGADQVCQRVAMAQYVGMARYMRWSANGGTTWGAWTAI